MLNEHCLPRLRALLQDRWAPGKRQVTKSLHHASWARKLLALEPTSLMLFLLMSTICPSGVIICSISLMRKTRFREIGYLVAGRPERKDVVRTQTPCVWPSSLHAASYSKRGWQCGHKATTGCVSGTQPGGYLQILVQKSYLGDKLIIVNRFLFRKWDS